MEVLNVIKDMLTNSEDMVQTNNFYYERHDCSATNSNVKVTLDYLLKKDGDPEIARIGMCKHCNTIFYHKDYQSKLL